MDEYIGIFKDLKIKGDRLLLLSKQPIPFLTVKGLDYNYWMGELSAALGCSHMERIKEILDKRAKVAGMYNCSLFIKRCSDIRKGIFQLPRM